MSWTVWHYHRRRWRPRGEAATLEAASELADRLLPGVPCRLVGLSASGVPRWVPPGVKDEGEGEEREGK